MTISTAEGQPYKRTSGQYAGALNTAMAAGAQLDPASAAMAADLATSVRLLAPRLTSDSAPVFIAAGGDPVWTINAPANAGGSTTIRAPAALGSLTGWGPDNNDKPLEIFDNITTPGAYKEARCWRVSSINAGTHTITASTLGVTSYGLGSDAIPFSQGYGTGCGLPIAAGLLRMTDYQNGAIEHAIRVAGPSYIKSTRRLPAYRSDQGGTGARVGVGALEMGVRFRLKASFDATVRTCWNPTGQSLTGPQAAARQSWVRMIATALKTYGMVVSDGAGANTYAMQMELDTAYGGTADWQSVFGPNAFGNPYWSWMIRGLSTAQYTGASATDGIDWTQFEVVKDGVTGAAPATPPVTPPTPAVSYVYPRP